MPGFEITPQHLLAIVLLTVLVIVGCWDVWASASGKPMDTVSEILCQWSKQFPVLPFGVGLLIGHLFWRTCIDQR